jgi:hypothetical protein
MVEHFALEYNKYDFLQLDLPGLDRQTVFALPYFLQLERQNLEQSLHELTREGPHPESCGGLIDTMLYGVQKIRRATYALMNPIVGSISTEWLLRQLSETRHTVTPTTLSRWRDAGLLRYQQKDKPEADSVASLLIATSLHKQRRGALPTSLLAGEPAWWCWRQDSPTSPVVSCPIPLPEDIPPRALLWSQWTGAAWQPAWLSVGKRGAIRWAGTLEINGKLVWNISLDTLMMWVPDIASNLKGLEVSRSELEDTPELLHTLANMALLRLSGECLRATPLQLEPGNEQ